MGSQKKKLDLSKLSARELLLIGESSTFSQSNDESNTLVNKCDNISSDDDSENEDDDEISEDSSEQSDSENDWEEVNDQHVEAELKRYCGDTVNAEDGASTSQTSAIPSEGLQIVIPREGVFRKGKKQLKIEDILRKEMNREKMELYQYLHKVSLLCQISRGLRLNSSINSPILYDALEDRTKGQNFPTKHLNLAKLNRLIMWFRCYMILPKSSIISSLEITNKLMSDDEFLVYQIMEKASASSNNTVMIFVAFLRHLKIDARLVISLQPIPTRPPTSELCRRPKEEKIDKPESKKTNKKKSDRKTNSKVHKSKESTAKKISGKNSGRKMISSSDSDHEESKKSKTTQRQIIGQDMWAEVYLVEEERWASVDIIGGKYICDKQLEMEATQPLSYVVGFENNGRIKDITRRYASEWLTGTQKLRIKDTEWWHATIKPYRAKKSRRDSDEDKFLDEHLISMPIPKSMSEIKGHPLFVLRRHLLKFEALYPDDPPSVGSMKNEPIYSREYVHSLHTRELWLREAKVVQFGEAPYKIVKARPKYDKLSGARLPEVPAELFGEWQTEDYVPPIAKNGIVPRNAWGNVELFHEKLLPQGCVHLRLPGLQRVAKKLGIDCSPAVVGFDFGCGGSRPAFDGFVVCEEFKETLLDAWNQDQDARQEKEEEKRLQRIYSNWRKIIRGLLIRDRLEKKYSINLSGKRKADCERDSAEATSSKKARGSK